MKNPILLALLIPIALLSVAAKGGGCQAASEEPIVAATPDASAPDAAQGSDCTLPEPTCPSGSTYSIPSCACVATGVADAAPLGAPDTAPPLSADCPIPTPADSPFDVYLANPPTGSTSSEFALTATGSAGDTVSLAFQAALSDGTLSFAGTGVSAETYELNVDYEDAGVLKTKVGWSVAGCGFLENYDFATGTHTP